MLTSRVGASIFVAITLGLFALGSLASNSSGDESGSVDAKQFEALWSDLEKGETPATRALLNFADRPKAAVAFLGNKLKPLTISSAQVKALLLKLGNTNEAVWKPAIEELDYFDPRLAIDLETLMGRYTEYPVRRRLVEVLSGRPVDSLKDTDELKIRNVGTGFNFSGKRAGRVSSWWAENRVERINSGDPRSDTKKKWTRAVRAIVLLEHIRTLEAIAIIKEMAGGHPDAYPTKVAREVLVGASENPSRTPGK
jgi:hypothetical protein